MSDSAIWQQSIIITDDNRLVGVRRFAPASRLLVGGASQAHGLLSVGVSLRTSVGQRKQGGVEFFRMDVAALRCCVDRHRLYVGWRKGFPLEAGLGRVACAGKVDPGTRDLVLECVALRGISGCDAHLRFTEVVKDEGDLGAMVGRDAAVDQVFVGEEWIRNVHPNHESARI